MTVFLGCTGTGRGGGGLCFLWFFVQELLEDQSFKASQKTGHSSDRLFIFHILYRLGELGVTIHLKDFDCQCTF